MDELEQAGNSFEEGTGQELDLLEAFFMDAEDGPGSWENAKDGKELGPWENAENGKEPGSCENAEDGKEFGPLEHTDNGKSSDVQEGQAAEKEKQPEAEDPETGDSAAGSSEENQEDPLVTVEVNGEQVALPVSTLSQAAQKGFAYEQAAAQLREMKEQLSVLDGYAALAGVNRGEYLETLRRQLERARVDQEAKRQNLPPEAARRVLAAERTAAELSRQRQEQERNSREEQQRLQPYLELLRRYPQLRDAGGLPREVGAQIRAGANPVVAYQDYLLVRRGREEQVRHQQEEARRKSPGSAVGTPRDEELEGAFAAFDSVFS